MPGITRWYIKSALLFFTAALLVGLAQAANSIYHFSDLISALGPIYIHFLMVGWVTQLIFGIVLWMFPKFSLEKPRGSENIAWAVFWLLNFGLLLRAVGEPLQALRPTPQTGWLLVLSALFQWLAGLGFVVNTWGRVKER
jgi:hypothetical protein